MRDVAPESQASDQRSILLPESCTPGRQRVSSLFTAAMTTLVLNQEEVRALLPMDACIDLVAQALEALARGAGTNPLRRGMLLPERAGVLGLMPGTWPIPRLWE